MDISCPDLSLLYLSIYDQVSLKNEFIGFVCLPIVCLSTGIHSVPLINKNGSSEGDYHYASLLIRINIENI